MKSLNFQKLNFQKEDFLSKTQMKNILGGYDDEGNNLGWGSCCVNGDCGSVKCRQWITCNGTFTKC